MAWRLAMHLELESTLPLFWRTKLSDDQMMYANQIKLRVLNWILPRLSLEDRVGSEVRMLDSECIADLLVAMPDKILGIEIKSKRDSVSRLRKQAEIYTNMFHASYLVIDKSDKRQDAIFMKLIPKSFGLIQIDNNEINILRDASGSKYLKKKWCVRWLNRKQLTRLLRDKQIPTPTTLDIEQLRRKSIRYLNRDTLNKAAISAVQQKLEFSHEVFISELGKITTEDDLANLQNRMKIIEDD